MPYYLLSCFFSLLLTRLFYIASIGTIFSLVFLPQLFFIPVTKRGSLNDSPSFTFRYGSLSSFRLDLLSCPSCPLSYLCYRFRACFISCLDFLREFCMFLRIWEYLRYFIHQYSLISRPFFRLLYSFTLFLLLFNSCLSYFLYSSGGVFQCQNVSLILSLL